MSQRFVIVYMFTQSTKISFYYQTKNYHANIRVSYYMCEVKRIDFLTFYKKSWIEFDIMFCNFYHFCYTMNRYINKYIAIVLNTCIPIYICSVDFIFPLSILHQNSIIIRYVNLRCNHIKHGTTVSNLRFMSVFVQIQYKVSGREVLSIGELTSNTWPYGLIDFVVTYTEENLKAI